MSRSLRGQVALWFGVISLAVYLVAAALVLAIESSHARRELQYLLYAQAEAAASYLAAGGRGFPELERLEEHTPQPLWLRVTDADGRELRATPGAPASPAALEGEPLGELLLWEAESGEGLARLRHPVWSGGPEAMVEAIASTELLRRRRRDVLLALALAGLVVLPMAAVGGRLLARRALAPVDRLMRAIRGLDSRRLDERLPAPGEVIEIDLLSREFNALLGRVEESVRATRRFTADASHELRTPISILRTGIEVALRKERSAGEYREVLQENLVEIRRVQRIVEGLLTLAREGEGDRGDAALVVDLAAIARQAARSVRPLADHRDVRLEPRLASTPVRGDPDQLQLLVANLLDNAVRFSPRGGAVRLELAAADGEARLRVHDEGPGVAPEDRDRLFERFYRGRRAGTVDPDAGGSAGSGSGGSGGLGLALVRWVAERHGGGVRLVEAEVEAPGAVFEVELPLADAPA